MKYIKLNRGKTALIDDVDFEKVNKYKWTYATNGSNEYVCRMEYKPNKRKIYLHRFIMNPIQIMSIDHINGNGLDNQRTNLRICTHLENSRNRKLSKNNKSGFKGVYFYKAYNKWQSNIKVNSRYIFLGYFETPQEGAKAYNLAAKKYFGNFSNYNII